MRTVISHFLLFEATIFLQLSLANAVASLGLSASITAERGEPLGPAAVVGSVAVTLPISAITGICLAISPKPQWRHVQHPEKPGISIDLKCKNLVKRHEAP